MRSGPVVGVDVGGTKLLAVTVVDGEVVDELRTPTPGGGDAIIEGVADSVARLSARAGRGPDHNIVAVGLGVAGLVDRDGVLHIGPNLPGVVDYPFGAALTERLGLPVVVDNDATCATWAEHELGAARGAVNAVLVTLGTGIGGGLVVDGALVRGARGFAGEPGHMVVDPAGPVCPCGRRGCWERFASGSGLGRLAREAAEAGLVARVVELAGGDPEAVRGEHVTAAGREGDAGALAVLDRFGWWVALGIANLVDLVDPEVVVVGGGLVEAGELLLRPVRASFTDLVLAPERRPPVRVVAAELGERAGAVGAALLATAAG
jgi:glucokinase